MYRNFFFFLKRVVFRLYKQTYVLSGLSNFNFFSSNLNFLFFYFFTSLIFVPNDRRDKKLINRYLRPRFRSGTGARHTLYAYARVRPGVEMSRGLETRRVDRDTFQWISVFSPLLRSFFSPDATWPRTSIMDTLERPAREKTSLISDAPNSFVLAFDAVLNSSISERTRTENRKQEDSRTGLDDRDNWSDKKFRIVLVKNLESSR